MLNKLINKETLLIAFVTFLSYGTAMISEFAAAKVYDFPFSMVIIDIKILYSSVMLTLLYASILSLAIIFILKVTFKLNPLKRNIASVLIVSFFFIIIGYLVYYITNDNLSLYSTAITSISIIVIYMPWKEITNKKNIIRTLKNNAKEESTSKIESDIHSLRELTGTGVFILFLYVLSVAAIGTNIARNPQYFFTFELNGERYAILKTYGDNLITAKLNEKNLKSGTFFFKSDAISTKELIPLKLDMSKKNTTFEAAQKSLTPVKANSVES